MQTTEINSTELTILENGEVKKINTVDVYFAKITLGQDTVKRFKEDGYLPTYIDDLLTEIRYSQIDTKKEFENFIKKNWKVRWITDSKVIQRTLFGEWDATDYTTAKVHTYKFGCEVMAYDDTEYYKDYNRCTFDQAKGIFKQKWTIRYPELTIELNQLEY